MLFSIKIPYYFLCFIFLSILPYDLACQTNGTADIIDGVCCPKSSFVNDNHKWHCEANKIFNMDKMRCECPSGMHFDNNKLQCVQKKSNIEFEFCECPQNAVMNEKTGFCECNGDLIFDSSLNLCKCPAGTLQNKTNCCPTFSRPALTGDGCQCMGDLEYDASSKQCKCIDESAVQHGTLCCRADQIIDSGTCSCLGGLETLNGECMCTTSTQNKCCQEPKVFDFSTKQCKCPDNMFETRKSSICCYVGQEENDSDGTCECPTNSGEVFDEETKRCKCPGELLKKIDGKCICPKNMLYTDDPKQNYCTCPEGSYLADQSTHICCPNDQMFNKETQTCSCKIGQIPTPMPDGPCKCPEGRIFNPFLKKCTCLAPQIEVDGKCVCENGTIWNNQKICCFSFEIYDSINNRCITCPDTFLFKDGKCYKCPLGFVRDTTDLEKCVASRYLMISAILTYMLFVLIVIFCTLCFKQMIDGIRSSFK